MTPDPFKAKAGHQTSPPSVPSREDSSGADVCARCGQPLTQRTADGGCLPCLMDFALLEDEEAAAGENAAVEVRRYAHFEIVLEPSGSLHELGHGAMGTTYHARDTVLHSQVALKVIRKQVADSAAVRARFLREARTAAKLRHPNVASVFHYGEQDGECYYAMELVEGETLEARVRRDGPLPANTVLEIATQVARALAAAEAQGLVHRDLKPSNIMLVAGHGGDKPNELLLVKVIDFGLAKVAAASEEAAGDHDTRHGFVGTPAYASPEQFDDKGASRVDTRSDIYSLGVTLWYLLSGRTPFVGRSLEEIQAKQIGQSLPIEQLTERGVPAGLIILLRSMLAADPGRRPQNARELLASLQRCRASLETHRGAWRRPEYVAILTFLGILLTLIVYTMVRRPPPAPSSPPTHDSVAVLPFENLGPNKAETFFTASLRDEITLGLARIEQLKVVGYESARFYPPGQRDLRHISEELGVGHLVEGSLTHEGDRVRVTVKLTDAREPSRAWTKEYEETLPNLFAVERQITRDLASQLRAKLSAGEQAILDEPPTLDPAAYRLYLQAIEQPHLFKGPDDFREGMHRRLAMLDEAVRRDANFVLAYCAMAGMHDDLFRASAVLPEERTVDHRSLADAALEKARRLQPDEGRVHLALASHLRAVGGDNEQARIELELARRSLPNDAELEQSAGLTAVRQGRWDEAARAYEKAAGLEPRDTQNLDLLCEVRRAQRRYAQADLALARFLAIKPATGEVYHRLWRAVGPLEERAELEPLRAALAEVTVNNGRDDAADPDIFRFVLALFSRDPETISRSVAAIPRPEVVARGQIYPTAWFDGMAARLRGDPGAARTAFAAARSRLAERFQANPLSGATLSLLAVTDAALGRKEEAVREGQRACEMVPPEKSALHAPAVACNLAIVYAWTDQPDRAFTVLNDLVNRNASLNLVFQPTYGDFRLNPVWDPLRHDPRFEELIQRLAPPLGH